MNVIHSLFNLHQSVFWMHISVPVINQNPVLKPQLSAAVLSELTTSRMLGMCHHEQDRVLHQALLFTAFQKNLLVSTLTCSSRTT